MPGSFGRDCSDHALLASIRAAAVAAVHAEIVELTAHEGRAGMVVNLRTRARGLMASAMAEEQVMSLAFDAAADDVAWGRPPLVDWPEFTSVGTRLDVDARARVEHFAACEEGDLQRRASEVAAAIEMRCIERAPDAFQAVRDLPRCLQRAAQLQMLLWDDGRIGAAPEIRAVMRQSASALDKRARSFDRPAPRDAADDREEPPMRLAWRARLQRWFGAIVRGLQER